VLQNTSGGEISRAGNGGNGGNGGNAVIADATLGGNTSSGNFSDISQENTQKIVLVPKAIQEVSSNFNAFVNPSYLG